MSVLNPKLFIKQIFVNELTDLSTKHHYISFFVMATGIEFLGKCLDSSAKHWNVGGRAEFNFFNAIDTLSAFEKYKPYKKMLYTDLRCGFAHSFVPKGNLTLSSKDEMPHMQINGGRLNLKCEDFYEDFKLACLEVIDRNFPEINDKMNKDLLFIPGENFNETTNIETANTQSIG